MRILIIAAVSMAILACSNTAGPKAMLSGTWTATGANGSFTRTVTDSAGRIAGESTIGAVRGTQFGDSVHISFVSVPSLGITACTFEGKFRNAFEIDGSLVLASGRSAYCALSAVPYTLHRS